MAKAIIRRVVFECDKVELSYWFDEGWGNGVMGLVNYLKSMRIDL